MVINTCINEFTRLETSMSKRNELSVTGLSQRSTGMSSLGRTSTLGVLLLPPLRLHLPQVLQVPLLLLQLIMHLPQPQVLILEPEPGGDRLTIMLREASRTV